MSRVVWDKAGERRYETGVDRGVLYLPDGSGVPWNGLTAVEEDLSDISSTPFFFDGIKYMETKYPGEFSATLKAFTYPDEFLQFDGYAELNNGILLSNQPVYDRFGLVYRTLIGNDIDGTDRGYKIHILYNLISTPDNRSYPTLSDQATLNEFSWKISGVPEAIDGYRPTVHIILDTTRLNPFLVADIERILYGQDLVQIDDPDVIDGGTPGNFAPDVLDGDPPPETPVDGGDVSSPSSSIEIDGGIPSTLPGTTILIDGGASDSSSSLSDIDGGTSVDPPPIPLPSDDVDGGSPYTSSNVVARVDHDVLFGGTPIDPGPLFVRGGTPSSSSTQSVLTDNLEPTLPPLVDLVELIDNWVLIDVVDNGDGSWTATGPDDVVALLDFSSFEIRSSAARYLDEETYEISTTHTF